MMELTEANLREYNDAHSCSSTPSREQSPATQIRGAKEGIVGILRTLRRFGPRGLKHIDDAEVCIDDKGIISCRGDEPQGHDDAAFWTRQVESLESKFYPLQRAVIGPPQEIAIDHEAQAEQDRIDQHHASWKTKMQLWSSDCTPGRDDLDAPAALTSNRGSVQVLHSSKHNDKKTYSFPRTRRNTLRAAQPRQPAALGSTDHNPAQLNISPPTLGPSPKSVYAGRVNRRGHSPRPPRTTRQCIERKSPGHRPARIRDILATAAYGEGTIRRSRRLAGLVPEYDLGGLTERSTR